MGEDSNYKNISNYKLYKKAVCLWLTFFRNVN